MAVPYKKLLHNVKMPVLGLGTWQLQESSCLTCIEEAWNLGYRHFDTAQIYQNHKEIGQALKGKPRQDLFLVSKLWHEEHHPKKVEPALDRALQELQTDYLDLYLVHWPKAKQNLPDVIHSMEKMREKGKIRALGVCNATIHHIQDILNQGLSIAVHQMELHLFFQQEEMTKFCKMKEIAITAYSPLARGEVKESAQLGKFANMRNKTPAQIAIAWCLHNDYTAIPKSCAKQHLEENFAAASIRFSGTEMQTLRAMNQDKRLIAPVFSEFDY